MNSKMQAIEHREWGFEDYLELALRKKWIILAVFAAVFTVSLIYSLSRRDVYSASTTFSIDEQTEFSGVNSNNRVMPYYWRMGPGKPLEYYNALIYSQPFRDMVVKAALADSQLLRNGGVSTDQVLEVLATLSISKEDEMSSLMHMGVRAFDPMIVYRVASLAALSFKER
ncbi:MAG: hypothetical protein EHM72_20170, partial [Calditrichaeota bacterium]